jgi:hypothetical protein
MCVVLRWEDASSEHSQNLLCTFLYWPMFSHLFSISLITSDFRTFLFFGSLEDAIRFDKEKDKGKKDFSCGAKVPGR